MKSAKQIANDMADAINIDSNLVRGFAQGFISVPVDFYYRATTKLILKTDG